MLFVKRKTVSAVMLTLLLSSMLMLALNIQPVKTEPTTIVVPDDYPTIQEAINAASDGDTIFVKSGTYAHVEISKSVNLCGESKYTTVIDGSSYMGAAVNVLADNVHISNFTIQYGKPDFYIDGHSHIAILDNIIKESSGGVIRFVSTFGNSLTGNLINGSGTTGGVNFDWANDTLVFDNTVTQCEVAINGGYPSYNNTFQNNNFIDNPYLITMNNVFDGCNFFHNNVENSALTYLTSSENCAWDNGSEGNYWSNYNGTDLDGDGIGDTPYIIDDDNQDNYPLMRPYVPFENQTIYIRTDGSVDPSGAPIHRIGNRYSLTTDVFSDSDGIVVERDSIVIDGAGYTLQGTGAEESRGIDLTERTNVTVQDTRIDDFYYGIWLFYSSSNSISGNTIADNWYGIRLYDSSNNSIANNTITNNDYGIGLSSSSNNSVSGNTFTKGGLEVWDSYQNVVEDNTVNGKVMVYLESVANYTVGDAGQVILINCTGIRVEHLNLSRTSTGVQLWHTHNSSIVSNNVTNSGGGIRLSSSSNNSVSGNTIANNWYGIWLYDSSNGNRVSGNTVKANYGNGIELSSSSNNSVSGNTIANNENGITLEVASNNIVSENTVTENTGGVGLTESFNNTVSRNAITGNNIVGVLLYYASFNTVIGNNITDTQNWGIVLEGSSLDNVIYHNNFVNNNLHTVLMSAGYVDSWDNRYPSGGNYWSGYTDADSFKGPHQNETGSDGVWDQPYIIDVDNQDRYPLTKPYGGPAGDVDGDRDVDIFDIVRMAIVYGVEYPDPRYDRLCDMDIDGDIDIFDIVMAAGNYGESW